MVETTRPEHNWPAVLLAALPHLILAFLATLTIVFGDKLTYLWGQLVYSAIMVLMFVVAWRRGWPLWSGSWVVYWLLLIFFDPLLDNPWIRVLDNFLFIYMLLPLGILGLLILIFQRRGLMGLLVLSSLLVPPVIYLTHNDNPSPLLAELSVSVIVLLLLACTTGAMVWLGTLRAGILLFITFTIGCILIYNSAYDYLPRIGIGGPLLPLIPSPPSLEQRINDFVPGVLAIINIALALVLLYFLRGLALQTGKAGRPYYVLLLCGIALTWVGYFPLYTRWFLMRGAALATLATLGIIVGLVLAVGAAMLLIQVVQQGQRWHGRWHIVLLPLLSAFSPLVVLPLARPFSTNLLFRYSTSFHMILLLSYFGVVVWSLAALWVIVHSDKRDHYSAHG